MYTSRKARLSSISSSSNLNGKVRDAVWVNRLAEEITLDKVAVHLPQLVVLPFLFNTFDRKLHAQIMNKMNDILDKAFLAFNQIIVNEGFIDFNLFRRNIGKITQR